MDMEYSQDNGNDDEDDIKSLATVELSSEQGHESQESDTTIEDVLEA